MVVQDDDDEVMAEGEAPLARHFAAFLCQLAGGSDAALALAAQSVSRATASGHICVDLNTLAAAPAGLPKGLIDTLRQSPVVGAPGEFRPLVLDEAGRLYLYRYWDYQQRLAVSLRERAASIVEDVDEALLREGLRRLFPTPSPLTPVLSALEGGEGWSGGESSASSAVDWQKVAAASAVLRRLCMISGGPGTGKTTTVTRILALLIEQARGVRLRVALAAPTGKAAARMQEAIRRARDSLDAPEEVRSLIPDAAGTLHRLLGGRPDSVYFRHDAAHPLPVDVLVVDEVSMVGLALMAKLTAALPAQARLILLGDRDQLAAVEAGAVLGDVCAGAAGCSAAWARRLASVVEVEAAAGANGGSPLRDAIVLLRHSYRFGAGSGIGRLAEAVRSGEVAQALALLDPGGARGSGDLHWEPVAAGAGEDLPAPLLAALRGYFDAVVRGADLSAVFAAFNRFRTLCAHRHGREGVAQVNARIERWLRAGGLARPREQWYAGRPVLITRNDHGLRLYNGDLGIALPDVGGRLRVFFEDGEHGLRALSPARLPPHETAYALTVHKAQGSEFDEVLLWLPDNVSPVLSRELLYTAVTRARQRVTIRGRREVIEAAIRQRHERASGLRDALWSPHPGG